MQGFGKIIENLETTTPVAFEWNKGEGVLLASAASFSGHTLKLQNKVGTRWVDIADATLTAEGGFKFVSSAVELRVSRSGTGAGIYVTVQSI
jgi:hypothetical protein